jgi:hypothetical protein
VVFCGGGAGGGGGGGGEHAKSFSTSGVLVGRGSSQEGCDARRRHQGCWKRVDLHAGEGAGRRWLGAEQVGQNHER